jgi:aminoglycoside 6'-N-acetyltransferase
MTITLTPLTPSDFGLLLEWLNAPHVHQWCDPEIMWSLKKVEEKYTSYTQGYKVIDGERKRIHAYIIRVESTPVGYFQIYNVYDFPRHPLLENMPTSLGACDIFIGNPHYLRKGIASETIILALNSLHNLFSHIVVDTHIKNIAAQKLYSKTGFKILKIDHAIENVRMVKTI